MTAKKTLSTANRGAIVPESTTFYEKAKKARPFELSIKKKPTPTTTMRGAIVPESTTFYKKAKKAPPFELSTAFVELARTNQSYQCNRSAALLGRSCKGR